MPEKKNPLKPPLGGGFKYFFVFTPYLRKIPILTNIFQRGWNHQPVLIWIPLLSKWYKLSICFDLIVPKCVFLKSISTISILTNIQALQGLNGEYGVYVLMLQWVGWTWRDSSHPKVEIQIRAEFESMSESLGSFWNRTWQILANVELARN